MGIICEVPVATGRGRRLVANGHLRRALTLAASVDVGELIRDCHGRRAVAGTFGRDIIPDAQPARRSRSVAAGPPSRSGRADDVADIKSR